jgi:hypothetical protein
MLPQSRDADIRDGKAKSSVVNVERGRLNKDGELVTEYDRRNRILTYGWRIEGGRYRSGGG